MIKVKYLADCEGANKYGTCVSCGRDSKDDPHMIRVTYTYHNDRCRTSTCLCTECRKLLFKTI
jgi:hypothetical protein